VTEKEIHITLRFNLATGKVGLDEIVHRLKELRGSLTLKMLKQILICYDDNISEHLIRTYIYLQQGQEGFGATCQKS